MIEQFTDKMHYTPIFTAHGHQVACRLSQIGIVFSSILLNCVTCISVHDHLGPVTEHEPNI